MSRYRGPRFKKIRRLRALPGLTNKRPRDETHLRNRSRFGKRSQYRIRLEEKQKLRFHYGITERQLLKYVRIDLIPTFLPLYSKMQPRGIF